jgi:hypothetical protein
MQLFEIQVELVSGYTVWLTITAEDAASAKRQAIQQIEDIRRAGYYADEISALPIHPIQRVEAAADAIHEMHMSTFGA